MTLRSIAWVTAEIPDALIQKGLRPSSTVNTWALSEIPDALIQKGLRRRVLYAQLGELKYQMP